MDTFSSIQDQLSRINHNLNSGFSKIYDELDQLSERVGQLERTSASNKLHTQLESIKSKVDLIPKIHDTQIGALETLLVGHQYQFRRLSNIISKDTTNLAFERAKHQEEDDPDDDFDEAQSVDDRLHKLDSSNLNGGQATSEANTRSQLNSSSTTTANTSLNLSNSSKKSHKKIQHNQIQNNTSQPGVNGARTRQQQGIIVNNRGDVTPANLSLMTSTPHQMESTQSHGQHPTPTSSRPSANLSALRSYTSIGSIDNEMSIPSPAIDDTNASSVLGQVNPNSLDVEVNSNRRSMWDSVPFRRLNPNLSSVQDVIDEYYYGFEGQPPLKFLEEHRRNWRAKERNLSKTFCRRYRVITALEAGIILYTRDFGLSESLAREKIINELESLRDKGDGKRKPCIGFSTIFHLT